MKPPVRVTNFTLLDLGRAHNELLDHFKRRVVRVAHTDALAAGASAAVDLDAAKTALLLTVTSTFSATLEIFGTEDDRTAGTPALYNVSFVGVAVNRDLGIVANLDEDPSSRWYCRITNDDAVSRDITFDLLIVPIET